MPDDLRAWERRVRSGIARNIDGVIPFLASDAEIALRLLEAFRTRMQSLAHRTDNEYADLLAAHHLTDSPPEGGTK